MKGEEHLLVDPGEMGKGTATHYALGVSGTSTLRLVGTISSQAIVAGNLINFPATDILEIRDPA